VAGVSIVAALIAGYLVTGVRVAPSVILVFHMGEL
jgi:hypothetical protein